jgi:UDP-N-acetylmuramyl pentapeptide synthase
VALKGERFDATIFGEAAARAPPPCCARHGQAPLAASGLPGILVPDARLALGELARAGAGALRCR